MLKLSSTSNKTNILTTFFNSTTIPMNYPGNQTEHYRKNENKNKNSHSSFVVFAGFPVRVSHSELVEIREQRRDHRVGWPVQDLAPT